MQSREISVQHLDYQISSLFMALCNCKTNVEEIKSKQKQGRGAAISLHLKNEEGARGQGAAFHQLHGVVTPVTPVTTVTSLDHVWPN